MQEQEGHNKRLLVFNCHEPWVYQLTALEYELDIIIGLKGCYPKGWDEQMRPVPGRARLLSLSEAQRSQTAYYCIITHNTTDLLDIRDRPEPRLLVLHSTLEGRVLEEGSKASPEQMKEMVHDYLKLVGGHAVAVSTLKGKSWGLGENSLSPSVDPADYLVHSGEIAAGLRICNFIASRKQILLWDFHERAFGGVPVRLVGHNPDMPGVAAAESWDHLKQILRVHRFYIHTADPRFEDGYNLATIEAMSAGLPVVGNRHPSSVVKHGISGFLSDERDELRKYAKMLLDDQRLAQLMGQKARETVMEQFSVAKFKSNLERAIQTARCKWESRMVAR
ncbi:MAG: glycosyltransferase [Planctomycetota bacterium]|jgi:glycosyltransferase involved in cell wall biosynthesis